MHLLAPVEEEKNPMGHFVQRREAVFSVNVPLGHGLHLSWPFLPMK
jgi:hypothetical protein